MSEELEKKIEQKPEEQQAEQPRSVHVRDIFATYPIDREKARDVVLMDISASLGSIAQSMQAVQQSLIVLNSHLEKANTLKQIEKL